MENVTAETDVVTRILLENDGHPIGYKEPSRFNTVGWRIFGGFLLLLFVWATAGIIAGFIPDHLEPIWLEVSTEPLADFAAFVGDH